MNKFQLNDLRSKYPEIHLYSHPLIGTEEIRQFVYCERILYFRHVLKAPMKKTYKMEVGEEKHSLLQKFNNLVQDEYSQKYYNIYLTDPVSGLVGLIDYFEFDGVEAFPVEIKTGNVPQNGFDGSHKYQVVAQAILIEKNFDFLVKKVRIYYSKPDKVIDYHIYIKDKLHVLKLTNEIAKIILTEKIPNPTKDVGKCIDCECRNFCYRS
ncbi:MAG: CRISPR-associated protein Cas4 [Promethearchaeota archaeon]